MKIIAFVPAKGSSERVPSKNKRVLDGDFLFLRKLKQLKRSRRITDVFLDTEDIEMARMAETIGVKVLLRDHALASNSTDGHELFVNECLQVPDADIYIQALCTSPFVDEKTIDRAIDALLASPENDSLVAVTRGKQYTWVNGLPSYGTGRIPNSVDLPETIVESMSLYIVKKESPFFNQKRFGVRPVLFELSPRENIDINYQEDLELSEAIATGDRQAEVKLFRALKSNLSSAVFSDLTKDLGLNCTVDAGVKPQIHGHILGRAKTLSLRALDKNNKKQGESHNPEWMGIYDALQSYDYIRAGDVIVVENEVKDRAYFGELNAHLAVRAGAVGVLVDGVTRDLDGVQRLDLPVYARGNYCNDIKYEGTLGKINEPIMFGGIPVKNNDVIFADRDGIVILPEERWEEILKIAIKNTINEAQIRISAAMGLPVDSILDKHGVF